MKMLGKVNPLKNTSSTYCRQLLLNAIQKTKEMEMEKLMPVNYNQKSANDKTTEDTFSYFETIFNAHAAYKCRKIDKDTTQSTIISEIGSAFYVKSSLIFMDNVDKKYVLTYALDETIKCMIQKGCTKEQVEKNPLIMGFLNKFFNVV